MWHGRREGLTPYVLDALDCACCVTPIARFNYIEDRSISIHASEQTREKQQTLSTLSFECALVGCNEMLFNDPAFGRLHSPPESVGNDTRFEGGFLEEEVEEEDMVVASDESVVEDEDRDLDEKLGLKVIYPE